MNDRTRPSSAPPPLATLASRVAGDRAWRPRHLAGRITASASSFRVEDFPEGEQAVRTLMPEIEAHRGGALATAFKRGDETVGRKMDDAIVAEVAASLTAVHSRCRQQSRSSWLRLMAWLRGHEFGGRDRAPIAKPTGRRRRRCRLPHRGCRARAGHRRRAADFRQARNIAAVRSMAAPGARCGRRAPISWCSVRSSSVARCRACRRPAVTTTALAIGGRNGAGK